VYLGRNSPTKPLKTPCKNNVKGVKKVVFCSQGDQVVTKPFDVRPTNLVQNPSPKRPSNFRVGKLNYGFEKMVNMFFHLELKLTLCFFGLSLFLKGLISLVKDKT